MGVSIQKSSALRDSKAMRLDVINREVNEIKEGQKTNDEKNRLVISSTSKTLQLTPLLRVPWWISGKESTCNEDDTSSIPGSERPPGRGHGNQRGVTLSDSNHSGYIPSVPRDAQSPRNASFSS